MNLPECPVCVQGRQHSAFLSVPLERGHVDAQSSSTARTSGQNITAGERSLDGHACQVGLHLNRGFNPAVLYRGSACCCACGLVHLVKASYAREMWNTV